MKLLTVGWSNHKASQYSSIWHAVEFLNPVLQVATNFSWHSLIPRSDLFNNCSKEVSNYYCKWRYYLFGSKSEAAIDKNRLCCNPSRLKSNLGFIQLRVSLLTTCFYPRIRYGISIFIFSGFNKRKT